MTKRSRGKDQAHRDIGLRASAVAVSMQMGVPQGVGDMLRGAQMVYDFYKGDGAPPLAPPITLRDAQVPLTQNN